MSLSGRIVRCVRQGATPPASRHRISTVIGEEVGPDAREEVRHPDGVAAGAHLAVGDGLATLVLLSPGGFVPVRPEHRVAPPDPRRPRCQARVNVLPALVVNDARRYRFDVNAVFDEGRPADWVSEMIAGSVVPPACTATSPRLPPGGHVDDLAAEAATTIARPTALIKLGPSRVAPIVRSGPTERERFGNCLRAMDRKGSDQHQAV